MLRAITRFQPPYSVDHYQYKMLYHYSTCTQYKVPPRGLRLHTKNWAYHEYILQIPFVCLLAEYDPMVRTH